MRVGSLLENDHGMGQVALLARRFRQAYQRQRVGGIQLGGPFVARKGRLAPSG